MAKEAKNNKKNIKKDNSKVSKEVKAEETKEVKNTKSATKTTKKVSSSKDTKKVAKEKSSKDKKSFAKDFKAELKKVTWPTPKQLVNNTTAVVVIVLITAIIVFALDLIFENLNKYDDQGSEIAYVVDEEEVNEGDFEFYTKEVTGTIITNTYTVPDRKTSITVTKNWNDNNNIAQKRPQSIQIQVKNGQEIVDTQPISGNSNVWTAQIDGLRKYDDRANEIRYTIDETSIDFYEKQVNGYTIINTFNVPEDKINMQITKIWEDSSNENGVRPESITLIIKEGVNEIKREEVAVEQDEQVYLVEGLDKYDEYGNEKEYTVDEENVEEYDKKVEGNIITNSIKKYKITTEVIGTGGTISGQNDTVYEEVSYGGENKKEVVITPEEGYKISSIKINGEEIEFIQSGEEYVLEKFVDVREDKHIEVEFEKEATSVVVKHVDEEGNNLVEPETIEGKVGDEYQTQAKDFEEYEIKEIIGNETGQMTAEQITVTYVYKKVEGSIEITKVDKKDNSKLIEGATFRVEKLKDNGEVDEEFSYQELTTDKEGKVKFEGLEVGKYRVTETRAPQGYELSKESIEIEITKENRDIRLTAENELKLVLPETGGINNTIIFVIIGFSAMIISLIIAKSEKIKKYYIRHK